ncbi:MAG: hypothetical protein LBK76_07805 [Verrucomicrobiales bacterium]|jgi:hypothetical protein|nr:hypothetical protein [Verrucomicrobiales bacterium]
MIERIAHIKRAMPASGLFAGKTWRVAPSAFPLDAATVEFLARLGPRLHKFLQAANLLYRKSWQGRAPAWIAEWLDLGKPRELVELARSAAVKNDLPTIIRPDLILADGGFALSEIDSVPGGVGLTAWLNETYAALGEPVVGGATGMTAAARRHFPAGSVVISAEAADYRPEMEWLYGARRVRAAERYTFSGEPVYRFFECFDWGNLPSLSASYSPTVRMDPPLKPFLEEKLWLALFWLRPLREFWRQELGDRYWRDLQAIIPPSWVVEPTELPPSAVLPGLEVQSWREVAAFSQKERALVLKVSGFSPLAWGSRGVTMGFDVSGEEWRAAVTRALAEFAESPRIMQRFVKGRMVEHPYWDEAARALTVLPGRARLCPYYFVEDGQAALKGVLVTITPADKKIIHGMSDAIIVPAAAAGGC